MPYSKFLAERHTRQMDFTGRPMKGMLYVTTKGIQKDENLKLWVERALKYARSLPAK